MNTSHKNKIDDKKKIKKFFKNANNDDCIKFSITIYIQKALKRLNKKIIEIIFFYEKKITFYSIC